MGHGAQWDCDRPRPVSLSCQYSVCDDDERLSERDMVSDTLNVGVKKNATKLLMPFVLKNPSMLLQRGGNKSFQTQEY